MTRRSPPEAACAALLNSAVSAIVSPTARRRAAARARGGEAGVLHLRSVVDVCLLAWVIYRALQVVRGTRALQVLSGLLLSVAMYALAERLQLYAVHWLLEKFFSYIVIAVLILFQGDIRRGLAGAGVRLFRPLTPGADSSAVEEVVRAATTMASRRIGALIAIEREASLDGPADHAARILELLDELDAAHLADTLQRSIDAI